MVALWLQGFKGLDFGLASGSVRTVVEESCALVGTLSPVPEQYPFALLWYGSLIKSE